MATSPESIMDAVVELDSPDCGCSGGGGPGGKHATSRAATKPSPDVIRAFQGLTTTASECAEDAARDPDAPCVTQRVARVVEAFADSLNGEIAAGAKTALLPSAATPGAQAIRAAAAALDCNSESCVVVHPLFRQYVIDTHVIPESIIDLELETRFKAQGPRDSTELLSNLHIDDTLQKWARAFPEFFPCPFAMMDFDRTKEKFATINLVNVLEGKEPLDLGPGFGVVRRACSCFGCVVNTDDSSGPGKHWVAVFVDCRPTGNTSWTVEYFNSAGRPPPKAMTRWMERRRAQLAAYRTETDRPGDVIAIPVTDMDHQQSQTECGLYALYYIRRRLEGVPSRFFFEQLIPDTAMIAFRSHVFRAM
jgi:hypothetical protein